MVVVRGQGSLPAFIGHVTTHNPSSFLLLVVRSKRRVSNTPNLQRSSKIYCTSPKHLTKHKKTEPHGRPKSLTSFKQHFFLNSIHPSEISLSLLRLLPIHPIATRGLRLFQGQHHRGLRALLRRLGEAHHRRGRGRWQVALQLGVHDARVQDVGHDGQLTLSQATGQFVGEDHLWDRKERDDVGLINGPPALQGQLGLRLEVFEEPKPQIQEGAQSDTAAVNSLHIFAAAVTTCYEIVGHAILLFLFPFHIKLHGESLYFNYLYCMMPFFN